MNVLGIGECMVELNQQPGGLLKKSFAGDVFNTLWYARALLSEEHIVAFHTAFGTDAISQEMKHFIEQSGIQCMGASSFENRMPGLYMIQLNGAERSFSYWRDQSAARLLIRDKERLWHRIAEADLVYLSGITLAILNENDVNALISQVRNHMKKQSILAFDPNIRPALWHDEIQMRHTIEAMASISDIVLPSYEDEADCFADVSPEETALRYNRLGADLVVVKNGEAATLSYSHNNFRSHPVKAASDIVDTTAAGDSFNGAFLAHYMMSGDINAAIQAAQECAALVVCERGALVPFKTLSSSLNL